VLLGVPLLLRWILGPSRATRGLIGLGTVAAVAHLLLFDPLLDQRCAAGCVPSPIAVFATTTSEGLLRLVDAFVPVVCACVGVVLAGRHPVRVRVACGALLLGTCIRAVALITTPTDSIELGWNRAAIVSMTLAVGAGVAVGLWPSLRRWRSRLEVARIVRRLAAARDIDDVSVAVARTVADPTAVVSYLAQDGWVDSDGNAVPDPPPGSVPVRRGGETVAAIVATPGAPTPVMEPRLGPTLELALANEQLRAVARARLRNVRESRARIVAEGDAARRDLERDLHDGAQQHLVALSFELRRARTRAHGARADGLDSAITRTSTALDELREIAHGIFPVTLSQAGLSAALHELASKSPHQLRITQVAPGRFPPEVEMAAYRFVAELAEQLPAEVNVRQDAGCIVVRAVAHGTWTGTGIEGDSDAIDRVGALGGTILTSPLAGGIELEAVLPCAS
jgi:signal transduction histidine kinase